MQRLRSQPRTNWQSTVESQGFHFHTAEGQPYWDESAYYRFTRAQIDLLEKATYALNEMCLQAVQHIIDQSLFHLFQIPEPFIQYVVDSWDTEEFTLYGRFDLAFDGRSPPKMLEYNADTPTSLLEQAVVQWFWFKDLFPRLDQFNSTHERLIEAWKSFRAQESNLDTLYFTCVPDCIEDFMTTTYLRDTAHQAGLRTDFLRIDQLGWNHPTQRFVDLRERPVNYVFKLYPWEWLTHEKFSPHLLRRTTRWLEAPWKMLLSNKAILPILYQLFPQSPYLLPASFDPLPCAYVRKPILSREGANVQIVDAGRVVLETDGEYAGPYIYQQLFNLPTFDGNRPVIGSWMINGYATGIGIREDRGPVTGNLSRFVPHVFAP